MCFHTVGQYKWTVQYKHTLISIWIAMDLVNVCSIYSIWGNSTGIFGHALERYYFGEDYMKGCFFLMFSYILFLGTIGHKVEFSHHYDCHLPYPSAIYQWFRLNITRITRRTSNSTELKAFSFSARRFRCAQMRTNKND